MKSEIKIYPHHLLLFLIPMLIFNLMFIIYPFVIEGMIIKAPITFLTTEFDIWLVSHIFGSFTYSNYALILIGSYLSGFVMGSLIAIILLWPIFRKLFSGNKVMVSERKLAARTALDMVIAVYFFYFIFDFILASVTVYPKSLPYLTFTSVFTWYLATGFVTDNALFKSFFPLRVYLKCKREGLTVKSEYLEAEKKKGFLSRNVLWTLKKQQY